MHFVLTLHSHLPYVLNHGRWPHGSDWLCEAAVDTYLPLLESLQALEQEGVTAPVTLGVTPVLANQLASGDFKSELEAFFGDAGQGDVRDGRTVRDFGGSCAIGSADLRAEVAGVFGLVA